MKTTTQEHLDDMQKIIDSYKDKTVDKDTQKIFDLFKSVIKYNQNLNP